MNVLKIYKATKTEQRKYFSDKSLEKVVEDIRKANLLDDFEFRTDNGYSLERKNTKEILERNFVDSSICIAPEHAQKFYLYAHSLEHKSSKPFGYIFTYELPFFKHRKGGAIDLVAYDDEKNILNLIEMKNCKMGSKKASNESLIRAILEIETYTKFINGVIDKEGKNGKLFNEIRAILEKLFNLKISEQKMKDCKIQKNILIPRSLYDFSKNKHKVEKEILKDIPKDINIYTFRLKNPDFDVTQKIGDAAKNEKIIFDFELIEN